MDTQNDTLSCAPALSFELCNTQACPVVPLSPVNCVVSEWSTASPCSAQCDGGVASSYRTITTFPALSGAACPSLIRTTACNTHACNVDCVVGPWGEWEACTKSCGRGFRLRRRSVVVSARGNGASCPVMQVRYTASTAVAAAAVFAVCGSCLFVWLLIQYPVSTANANADAAVVKVAVYVLAVRCR